MCTGFSVYSVHVGAWGDLAYISRGKTFCTNPVTLDLIKPLKGRWDQIIMIIPF